MAFKDHLFDEFPTGKLQKVRKLGEMSGHRFTFICKHPHKARSSELLAFHLALDIPLHELIERWGVASDHLTALERNFYLQLNSHSNEHGQKKFLLDHGSLSARA